MILRHKPNTTPKQLRELSKVSKQNHAQES
jgi:hypothetical protein